MNMEMSSLEGNNEVPELSLEEKIEIVEKEIEELLQEAHEMSNEAEGKKKINKSGFERHVDDADALQKDAIRQTEVYKKISERREELKKLKTQLEQK